MSNEFCHCDEERGSDRIDSFVLEILGLLSFGCNDRFEFYHCDEERGSNLNINNSQPPTIITYYNLFTANLKKKIWNHQIFGQK
ncbi:MAG: hypothetical protein AAF378_22620 [Cyanobacteria bacterium P01_A01_bin.84]